MIVEDVGEKIENVFSRFGIPTRIVFPERQLLGSGPIEVVFPMHRELDLQQAARAAWSYLARHVGDEGRFLPRTIQFHLAFEVFGAIGVPRGGFISTNINNLEKPGEMRRALVEDPVLDGFGVRSPDNYRWDASVLYYDVDIVIGAQRVDAAKQVAQQVVAVAAQFNQQSRLLKIGKFRCAWTQSRRVSPQELRYDQVSIPVGA